MGVAVSNSVVVATAAGGAAGALASSVVGAASRLAGCSSDPSLNVGDNSGGSYVGSLDDALAVDGQTGCCAFH